MNATETLIFSKNKWLQSNTHSFRAPSWNSSEEMKVAVRRFAREADLMALRILEPSSQSQSRATEVHHHHYSSWRFWPLWYQPSVVVWPDRNRSNEQHGATLFLLGLAATVISGIGLYLTGGAIKRYQEARASFGEAYTMHRQLHTLAQKRANMAQEITADEKVYFEQGQTVALLQGRLSRRKINSALVDLALRVTLTVAALVTLTGTLMVLASVHPFLPAACITAGAIAGLVAGGGMIFKSGLGGFSRQEYQEASLLHQAAELLQRE